MKSSLPKFALSALATSLLVACGGGGSTPPATGATPQAVTLNFDVVNGAAVVGTTGCTTPLTVGTAPAVAPATVVGTKGTLTDMRYYVSKVSMIDAAGTRFPVALTETADQSKNVALLDFETGPSLAGAIPASTCVGGSTGTNTKVVGTVATGTYVGVEFNVGVPILADDGVTSLNHSDVAAATTPSLLRWAGMAWAWQSGRKFTKIEFVKPAVGATAAVATMVHLGSGGCPLTPLGTPPNACLQPNNAKVTFATGFNAATNKIALDLGSLWGGVDLTTTKTWMSAAAVVPAPVVVAPAVDLPRYYFGKFNIDPVTNLPLTTAPVAPALFVIK
ncbi:MAG: MbnP family copper-binding protein [Gallionella sp.]